MFFVLQQDSSFLLTDERMRNKTPNEQTEFYRREFFGNAAESEELTDEEKRKIKYGLK